MTDTLTKEVAFRTAIHGALDHFELVDQAFDWPIAPLQRERRLDGGTVAAQTVGEAAHLGTITLVDRREPGVEPCAVPCADQPAELLGHLLDAPHLMACPDAVGHERAFVGLHVVRLPE